MAFDKDCPCTLDCPDRPNCKGCERGNAYRQAKNEANKQKSAEADFRNYWHSRYNTAMKKAEKFKKGDIK